MNTKESSPDPQFVESIIAGLTYWQERTEQLDDQAIKGQDAQRQNLYRIVCYGLALPQTWQHTAVVALQAFDLIERRGYWQEWIPILKQCAVNFASINSPLCLNILNQLGILHRLARQLPEAIRAHQEANAIADTLNNTQLVAEAEFHLAEDFLQSRRYTEAEQYGLAALTKFSRLAKTESWQAAALNTLGLVARSQGEENLAIKRLSEAVALRRSLNQTVRLARSLNDLAITLQSAGKIEEARHYLTEAAALLTPTVYEFDKVMVQINLGSLYFQQKQWAEAESTFRQADSVYLRQSGHIYYRAMTEHNLGETLLKQYKLEEAQVHLNYSIDLWQQASDNLMMANSLGSLGEVLVEQGKPSEAVPLFKRAINKLSNYHDDSWAYQLLTKFTIQLATLSA